MFHVGINQLKKWVGMLSGGEKAASVVRGKRSLRGAAGSLFLEAAIIAPTVIVGALGTFEVLNMYRQVYAVNNVAHSIAMAIQQNPTITSQELYTFSKSLGGSALPMDEQRWGTAATGWSGTALPNCTPTTCKTRLVVTALASTTPPTQDQVMNSPIHPTPYNISNPWLRDSDPSNDSNPYYVGVAVSYELRSAFKVLSNFGSADGLVRQNADLKIWLDELRGRVEEGAFSKRFDESTSGWRDEWLRQLNNRYGKGQDPGAYSDAEAAEMWWTLWAKPQGRSRGISTARFASAFVKPPIIPTARKIAIDKYRRSDVTGCQFHNWLGGGWAFFNQGESTGVCTGPGSSMTTPTNDHYSVYRYGLFSKSPDEICKEEGFAGADSYCSGVHPLKGTNFAGSLLSNDSVRVAGQQTWAIACKFGEPGQWIPSHINCLGHAEPSKVPAQTCPANQFMTGISGSGSPVCVPLNAQDSKAGSLTWTVRTTPFDSSKPFVQATDGLAGNGWQGWNMSMEAYFAREVDANRWLDKSREHWREKCLSKKGELPESHYNDSISFEYCGRFACAQETNGAWPFMARSMVLCKENGSPDCNNSKFYISWACLYDAPPTKR